MKVTVVVTTVGGPWLDGQLAALSAQTLAPEQLVLVNNGPAGAVDDVVARWQEALPSLELVEDRGMAVCGYARNAGAARARHPGLLFLDDDDVAAPNYVEAMSRALDDAELVAARIDLARLNRPRLRAGWSAMQADGPMTYHDFLPWVIGGAMGVRRRTFVQLGGFDTALRVAEDTDLSWRVQLDAGGRLAFVADTRLCYRFRATPGAAFRQARMWAAWDAVLHDRYGPRGLPARRGSLRAVLRWGRPVLAVATARERDDLVVAARLLGGCVGRLEGGVRHRRVRR